MKLFRPWFSEWKARLDGGMKVYKKIEEFIESDLNFYQKTFFAEARKENGEMYPPGTLKEIASMTQLFFHTKQQWEFSFSSINHSKNQDNHWKLKWKFRHKHETSSRKRRELPISREHENALWNNGGIRISNPKQPVNTLIYQLGIPYSRRAAKKHIWCLIRLPTSVQAWTRNFKNYNFGIKRSRMEPKTTRIYLKEENHSRCVVCLY